MKLTTLTSAILLSSLPFTGVFAAALDRSGQSIQAFLQPGNYAEAGISVLDANVSGKMTSNYVVTGSKNPTIGANLRDTELSDMAESFYFPSAAVKVQINDNFSVGLIYDQPFGAKAKYSTDDARHNGPLENNLKTNQVGAFHFGDEATEVEVNTQSLSLIFGYQPTENWNLYAGPVYQTVKGNVQLRGSAYGPLGGVNCTLTCNANSNIHGVTPNTRFKGYEAAISEDAAIGWLAGVAYQIPEIALKASLTYRAEVDHKVDAEETMPWNSTMSNNPPLGGGIKEMASSYNYGVGKTEVTTPQSINLDFQSGIMENTIAFAQLRWVDWSEFKIRPHKFGQLASGLTNAVIGDRRGFDLVAYEKDQISANVGVGRKINDQWAGSVMVGWDSGAGNPVSTLGPTEGYWSLGIGGQYSPTAQTFVQAGVKYFWLGDAKSQVASHFGTDTYVADFEDNDAIGYSLKIGYRF